MASQILIFVACLLCIICTVTGYGWNPSLPLRMATSDVQSHVCGPSMQLASPQIAKPKVDLGKSLGLSQPEAAKPGAKTAAPKVTPIKKTQDDETPMYKVILLGDPEYEQAHVVTQITKVIPSVKKEEAIRIFVEAQMLGTSVIIVCTEEHAEHYAQQLKRQQIYAKIEKDE